MKVNLHLFKKALDYNRWHDRDGCYECTASLKGYTLTEARFLDSEVIWYCIKCSKCKNLANNQSWSVVIDYKIMLEKLKNRIIYES